MKLLRVGTPGKERPALRDGNGILRDLTQHIADIDASTVGFLDKLSHLDATELPPLDSGIRIGPCIANVGKFICIGLNYADHAAETGQAIPAEPIFFMKATSAISGPNDPVFIPPGATKTDWEVELGVVIGATARHVPEHDADRYIAGYCLINDVSERAYQLERGGTWDKGKGYDSFGPIGPWLVTPDEIEDPQDLRLWLEVDGHRYQDGNTKTMVFGVRALISYVSQFLTLMPGDVISTGTPPGVGMGQRPPVFLRANQTMRLGIDGLGEQRQVTVPSPYA